MRTERIKVIEVREIQNKLERLISMVDRDDGYGKQCADLFVLLSDFANLQLRRMRRHEVSSSPQSIALFAGISATLTNALYRYPEEVLTKIASVQLEYFRHCKRNINNCKGLHITATGAEKGVRTLYVTIASGLILSYFIPTVVQGNYSVTGCHCGAFAESDIMKYAGYKFSIQNDADSLLRNGFAYLHAPLYHPILALYAHVRGDLSFPDVFKLTTALFDPSMSRYSFVGIWEQHFASCFCNAQLYMSEVEKGIVVSSKNIDEFTDAYVIGDRQLGIKSNYVGSPKKLKRQRRLQSTCDVREEWNLILDVIRTRPSQIKDARGILVWRNAALIMSSIINGNCVITEAMLQAQLAAFEDCHGDIVAHVDHLVRNWRSA